MMSEEEKNKHHVWCNFFLYRKREGCSMCDDLFKHYPMKGTEEEMMKKHFPDNVIVERKI